jgi:hypothetical protein
LFKIAVGVFHCDTSMNVCIMTQLGSFSSIFLLSTLVPF